MCNIRIILVVVCFVFLASVLIRTVLRTASPIAILSSRNGLQRRQRVRGWGQDKEQHALMAEIFFINLDSATLRQRCIQTQLDQSHAPYKVTRFAARVIADLQDPTLCPPSLLLRPTQSRQDKNLFGPDALWCSHYSLWQQMTWRQASDLQKPNFLIIFEDDVVLRHPTNFWPRVDAFLKSDCAGFDWILVDAHALESQWRKFDRMKKAGHEPVLEASSHQNWNAQMVIVRTSVLPTLIKFIQQIQKHPWPIDMLHMEPFLTDRMKFGLWQPGISMQMKDMMKHLDPDEISALQDICPASKIKCDPNSMHVAGLDSDCNYITTPNALGNVGGHN